MSELKVYHHELRHNEYEEFYLKYEADKVIAKLESEITQLSKQSSCKFSDDCLRVRQLKRELRRQKYKRCMDKAKLCESEEKRLEAISPIFDTDKECWEYNSDYWYKWRKLWMELTEKFKEAK